MASATDRARFQIEQTVPSLREWERRKLFTKPELIRITQQRTTHETRLASREATPQLYLSLLAYEFNLTHLLSLRLNRSSTPQKVSQKQRQAQQKRIFSILDRSVKRFQGHLELWSQYLNYCRDQGAVKRGQRVLTDCLRLFPRRAEVWGYAAGWAEGMGDLSGARGYFLRGLRFCKGISGGKDLYLRFASAEMRWVRERRKILGLPEADKEGDESVKEHEDEQNDEAVIRLPAEENEGGFPHFSSTPAMTGAIPQAIFDEAMKTYPQDEKLAENFFGMFAQHKDLSFTQYILDYVVESAHWSPALAASLRCQIPVAGLEVDSEDFAVALRESFTTLSKEMRVVEGGPSEKLVKRLLKWLRLMSEDQKLISELQTIIGATVKRLEHIEADVAGE